jgi:hypothetical protein
MTALVAEHAVFTATGATTKTRNRPSNHQALVFATENPPWVFGSVFQISFWVKKRKDLIKLKVTSCEKQEGR